MKANTKISCRPSEKEILDYLCGMSIPLNEEDLYNYDGETFVRASYRYFLLRGLSTKEISDALILLDSGMSKKGFLYIIVSSEEFNDRFTVCNKEDYKKEYIKYEWDVSYLCDLDDCAFVINSFRDLLHREPSTADIQDFSASLYSGMPKKALLHIIVNSQEIKNIKTIKDAHIYEDAYNEYQASISKKSFRQKMKRKIKNAVDIDKVGLMVFRNEIIRRQEKSKPKTTIED